MTVPPKGLLAILALIHTKDLGPNNSTLQKNPQIPTTKLSDKSLPITCKDVKSPSPRRVVILASGMEVMCDTDTDHGGWLVIQRRASQDLDFYRGWADYKYGFGDVHENHWLGLEKVHRLTFNRRYELRVDITFKDQDYYAVYQNFRLYGEPEYYSLHFSNFSGTAGDSLTFQNGRNFTTMDNDNDNLGYGNCAEFNHGAWWYNHCHHSNLNGEWASQNKSRGVVWMATTGLAESASFTEMKIRPLDP